MYKESKAFIYSQMFLKISNMLLEELPTQKNHQNCSKSELFLPCMAKTGVSHARFTLSTLKFLYVINS